MTSFTGAAGSVEYDRQVDVAGLPALAADGVRCLAEQGDAVSL